MKRKKVSVRALRQQVKQLTVAIEARNQRETQLLLGLKAAQQGQDFSKQKAEAEMKMLEARTRFVSVLGQSFEALSKVGVWAIGKEQL